VLLDTAVAPALLDELEDEDPHALSASASTDISADTPSARRPRANMARDEIIDDSYTRGVRRFSERPVSSA
jgi:hypothetical protein